MAKTTGLIPELAALLGDNFPVIDLSLDEQPLGKCMFCRAKVFRGDFRDELSVREWHISHICMECQDKSFGK